MDPSFTAAYYNKGVAENESEKFSDGVVTLSQLIKTYPSYSKAYFQRGRSYQGLDDYLNAEKDYQNAIVLDKNNPNAFYNFGTLRFLQKDYNGAIQYFTQCLFIG